MFKHQEGSQETQKGVSGICGHGCSLQHVTPGALQWDKGWAHAGL